MAVLEKIRVKMGVFITVIIGVALLSFVVDADTLRSALSMFSSKYDVGEMNGKAISYKDFQKRIDYFTRINQLMTGSAALDEKSSEMVNQSSWQDLLSDIVLIPAIEKAGIAVGDEEMFDLSQGSNISQVLMRERAFLDANGQFDRGRMAEFIKSIPRDNTGDLSTYWEYLEKNMYVDQMVGKYVTLLAKSTIQNPVQMRRAISDNNVTSDVSFIIQPYGFAQDTTISVSSKEVKDFYNKQKHNFEQPAGRDLEYVVFEVVPSAEDISAAESDIEKLMDEFRTTTNMRGFLVRNSDKSLDNNFYKQGELVSKSPVLDSFAFKAKVGEILEPFKEGDIYRAAKLVAIKQLPDSVFVNHILLANTDKVAAKKSADSLMNVIEKGADFSQVASANSLDKNPEVTPGELGWMTQAAMIPGFDTCFVAPLNKLFTIETNYGLHIVKVTQKTKVLNKVQLAILEKGAIASKETFQNYYSQANELASKSDGKIEKFNQLTAEKNLIPLQANNIPEGAKTISNYNNAREITRWAYQAKVGDVSQIISIDNKYFFIVALTKVREAGIPSLESIQNEIVAEIRREKAQEKALAKVKEQVAGLSTLGEIAEKLGTTVSTQTGISFGAHGSDRKIVV